MIQRSNAPRLHILPLPCEGVNNTTTAPTISDGVFREYRLAVYMTNEGFRSEQLNQDVSKVKAFWKELETFLNNIYVRDLGVRFTIVQDERLIEKSYKARMLMTRAQNSSMQPSGLMPTTSALW